jgi:hypothetical protein
MPSSRKKNQNIHRGRVDFTLDQTPLVINELPTTKEADETVKIKDFNHKTEPW